MRHMHDMAQETDTPRETLAAATTENALPPDGIALLGTFEKPSGSEALIRYDNGRVRKVGIGDTIGRRQVVAIDSGTLMLMRDGKALRLTMPGG